jgi:hypothetical protein
MGSRATVVGVDLMCSFFGCIENGLHLPDREVELPWRDEMTALLLLKKQRGKGNQEFC